MPWLAEPIQLEHLLLQIVDRGFTPILAHPERYLFYFYGPDRYSKLREMRCMLQLNLLSPAGYYGKEVVKAANYLIKNNLYGLIGTDLHHQKQLDKLIKYVKSGRAHEDLGHLDIKNRELF